jgi:hypothetical protein
MFNSRYAADAKNPESGPKRLQVAARPKIFRAPLRGGCKEDKR